MHGLYVAVFAVKLRHPEARCRCCSASQVAGDCYEFARLAVVGKPWLNVNFDLASRLHCW